ncbi:MAG: tetratricopeptide repeat protein [Candidatus Eremiobacteraeota bacterium]|nr:tetratricopeptide repeat protein [Candidatus Eremiobacteraeota bacterium]
METLETAVHPLAESVQAARAHIDEGNYQEAVDLLTAARKEKTEGAPDKDVEDLHYTLGLCFNQLNRAGEALPHARKSLRMAEAAKDAIGQARSYEQLGTAAYKKNEHRNSLELYQRSLKFWQEIEDKPGQARCLRDIGSIQSDLGQDAEAEESFNQSKALFQEIEDEEGVVACITNIGLLAYRSKGSEGALDVYKKSFEDDKLDHYLLHNNTGFLELVEGRFDEAQASLETGRADLEKRGARDDNAALLYLNLGIVSALKKAPEAALENLEKAQELFEQFPEGRAVEVVVLALREPKEGFDPYVVVEDAHKIGITHLNRAAVLVQQGKLDEALAEAEKGHDLDRNLPYPHFCLGWVHLAREEKDDANRCFKRAAGMDPNNQLFKQALEAINPFFNTKVGRNEPCPCGSGKKFKKCHGTA